MRVPARSVLGGRAADPCSISELDPSIEGKRSVLATVQRTRRIPAQGRRRARTEEYEEEVQQEESDASYNARKALWKIRQKQLWTDVVRACTSGDNTDASQLLIVLLREVAEG